MAKRTPRERMIDKLRALQAWTKDRGFTEAEAEFAARKVDQLMREYDLTRADLSEPDDDALSTVALDLGDPPHPVRYAGAGIGRYTDTIGAFPSTDDGQPIVPWRQLFIGERQNVQAALTLFTIIRQAIDREWTDAREAQRRTSTSGRFSFVKMSFGLPWLGPDDLESFGYGLAARVVERLDRMRDSRLEAFRTATGRELVPVPDLISRVEKQCTVIPGADEHMEKATSAIDAEAAWHGARAGDRVPLDPQIGGGDRRLRNGDGQS